MFQNGVAEAAAAIVLGTEASAVRFAASVVPQVVLQNSDRNEATSRTWLTCAGVGCAEGAEYRVHDSHRVAVRYSEVQNEAIFTRRYRATGGDFRVCRVGNARGLATSCYLRSKLDRVRARNNRFKILQLSSPKQRRRRSPPMTLSVDCTMQASTGRGFRTPHVGRKA